MYSICTVDSISHLSLHQITSMPPQRQAARPAAVPAPALTSMPPRRQAPRPAVAPAPVLTSMPPRRQAARPAAALAPAPKPPTPTDKRSLTWTISSTIVAILGLGMAAGALYLGWAAWMATEKSNLVGVWKDCQDRDVSVELADPNSLIY